MTDLPRLKGTLSDWIANAAPGDRVIVQTSTHGANGEAMQARAAGLITTVIRRKPGTHAFDLIAIRCKSTGKRIAAPHSRGFPKAGGRETAATRGENLR